MCGSKWVRRSIWACGRCGCQHRTQPGAHNSKINKTIKLMRYFESIAKVFSRAWSPDDGELFYCSHLNICILFWLLAYICAGARCQCWHSAFVWANMSKSWDWQTLMVSHYVIVYTPHSMSGIWFRPLRSNIFSFVNSSQIYEQNIGSGRPDSVPLKVHCILMFRKSHLYSCSTAYRYSILIANAGINPLTQFRLPTANRSNSTFCCVQCKLIP